VVELFPSICKALCSTPPQQNKQTNKKKSNYLFNLGQDQGCSIRIGKDGVGPINPLEAGLTGVGAAK
jgi:hypothetical protein